MIADPAIDLGPLLYHYVEEKEWESWLERYGASLTDNLKLRMAWYVLAETAMTTLRQKAKRNQEGFNQGLEQLHLLLKRLLRTS